jgi:hypothetical protein
MVETWMWVILGCDHRSVENARPAAVTIEYSLLQ